MANSTRKNGTTWTPADVTNLLTLARCNTPTRVIALKLARTTGAVFTKASNLGVSLKPTNQSPYGRRRG